MTGPGSCPTLDVGCIDRNMPSDETRSALPVGRAFVVHLRSSALPEEGRMAGRVEHVTSGRSEHFESLSELLAFLGRVLRDLREDIE